MKNPSRGDMGEGWGMAAYASARFRSPTPPEESGGGGGGGSRAALDTYVEYTRTYL